MAEVWSEINKIVNAVIPVADAFSGTLASDIVDMEGYKKCTFIIITGATSTGSTAVTVKAGIDNSTCATACTFRYRTMIAAVPPAVGSDVPSALSSGYTTFTTTVSKAGGMYIIEVDAADVAGAIANGDHCKLQCVESVASAVTGSILAILSEPRYPQGVLDTVIG